MLDFRRAELGNGHVEVAAYRNTEFFGFISRPGSSEPCYAYLSGAAGPAGKFRSLKQAMNFMQQAAERATSPEAEMQAA